MKGEDPRAEARGGAAKGFAATDPRIEPYVLDLVQPEDPTLAAIRARSEAHGLPRIAVSPMDGRHLEILARIAGARRAVEIGTLAGYSAVSIARGLAPDGILFTFERQVDYARLAAEGFAEAGLTDRIRQIVGDAHELLGTIETEGPFDLVFLDADKAGYPAYAGWAARHLRVGGVLVADNVFRRAAFPIPDDIPGAAEALKTFNRLIAGAAHWRGTFLPAEDGLAVAVKVAEPA